jgi:hypothetical protein
LVDLDTNSVAHYSAEAHAAKLYEELVTFSPESREVQID